jgi:hypothetical protein
MNEYITTFLPIWYRKSLTVHCALPHFATQSLMGGEWTISLRKDTPKQCVTNFIPFIAQTVNILTALSRFRFLFYHRLFWCLCCVLLPALKL